jgi:hypothetical protein
MKLTLTEELIEQAKREEEVHLPQLGKYVRSGLLWRSPVFHISNVFMEVEYSERLDEVRVCGYAMCGGSLLNPTYVDELTDDMGVCQRCVMALYDRTFRQYQQEHVDRAAFLAETNRMLADIDHYRTALSR